MNVKWANLGRKEKKKTHIRRRSILAGAYRAGRRRKTEKKGGEGGGGEKNRQCKRQYGVIDYAGTHANINDILSFECRTTPMATQWATQGKFYMYINSLR